ncbi:type II secretion system protein N [Maricaulis parjimensis]|uniref:type II secretion system protein N n=1 Tax=Maricaulis parjimensis TaxID=144023 RepID=UPI0019393DC7|nr:type II secretion system protein N [Maricaulis parjimensis]
MNQAQAMTDSQKGRTSVPRPARLMIGLAELGLLVALTFILARLIWLIAFGASAADFQQDTSGNRLATREPAYVADLSRLREGDLFADHRIGAEPVAAAQANVQETQLNLTLRGIRRGATPDSGGAIIQTPDNRQRFFAAGHTILDGVTLEEVHVDHVLIDRRGVIESLYLRDEAGGAGRATSRRTVTTTGGTQSIEGLFRAEPVRENGQLTGYRVQDGNPALLAAMGVREGDILTAINNRPVSEISDLGAEFARLRGEDHVELSINRGGLPLSVQVELP